MHAAGGWCVGHARQGACDVVGVEVDTCRQRLLHAAMGDRRALAVLHVELVDAYHTEAPQ